MAMSHHEKAEHHHEKMMHHKEKHMHHKKMAREAEKKEGGKHEKAERSRKKGY